MCLHSQTPFSCFGRSYSLCIIAAQRDVVGQILYHTMLYPSLYSLYPMGISEFVVRAPNQQQWGCHACANPLLAIIHP